MTHVRLVVLLCVTAVGTTLAASSARRRARSSLRSRPSRPTG